MAEELAEDLEETFESVLFAAIPGLTDLDVDLEGPSRSVANIVADFADIDEDLEGLGRSCRHSRGLR